MAVVAEITAANGVRVRIHDDDMAPRGSARAAAIKAEQCRAARAILIAWDDLQRRDGHGRDTGDQGFTAAAGGRD